MDIFHAVKQLAHELDILEAQIIEKKVALKKLWGTLDRQEQLLINSPSTAHLTASADEASPPAPKEATSTPKATKKTT